MDEYERRFDPNEATAPATDPAQPSQRDPESEPLPILPARILTLLFEPTKLFRALRNQPVFWGAMFLGAALVAVSALLIPTELYEEAARRQFAEVGQEVPEMPEGATAGAGRIGRIFAVGGAIVVLPIMTAIFAGIFSLVFRFGMGYEGNYRQYISVVTHSFLVSAVGAVLLTPLRIAAGRADLTLNPGAFVSFLGDGFIGRFLQSVDLLNLWAYVLIGLGISVVDGTRPARISIGVTTGLALFFAAVVAFMRGLAVQ